MLFYSNIQLTAMQVDGVLGVPHSIQTCRLCVSGRAASTSTADTAAVFNALQAFSAYFFIIITP